MKAPLLAVLLVAACDGPETTPPDARGLDGAACTRPALDAPWLTSYLGEVVGQLATAPRFTNTQRMAARSYLTSQLTALGWSPQLHTFNTGVNVHVTIPATMGNAKEVIVGAHYDTVSNSPGANDNASGVAAVLAIARYLKDVPCRTAPVTVVLFDVEESGLSGSRAFAVTKTPSLVRAVHTIDQVAWDGDNDRRFELEVPTAALEAEYRMAAQRVGANVTTTSTQGTDHEAFRDLGFAAIGLTEEYVNGDTSPHRHTPNDTAGTVAMPYLALATKLAAQVVIDEVAQ